MARGVTKQRYTMVNGKLTPITAQGNVANFSAINANTSNMGASKISALNTIKSYAQGGSSAPATGLSYAGGGDSGQTMKEEWQKSYDEARASNKGRQDKVGQMYTDRYNTVMGGIKNMGDASRSRIVESGRRRGAESTQSAIGRNLNMSTIEDSLQNSINEGTDANLAQLDESIMQTKAGYESSLRKDEADFWERISDPYPDEGRYSSMFQQYGQGQAGTGTGGMAGGAGGLPGAGGSRFIGHSYSTGAKDANGMLITSNSPNNASHHQFSDPKGYSDSLPTEKMSARSKASNSSNGNPLSGMTDWTAGASSKAKSSSSWMDNYKKQVAERKAREAAAREKAATNKYVSMDEYLKQFS